MADSLQIILPDAEQARLINRIEEDFLQAKASHQKRCNRFAGYMQKWQNRVDAPKAGDEDLPNCTVPLIEWQTFAKLARDIQALIGDDAEITARPTGPGDADKAHKVGRYMTSRVFDQMKILNPLIVFQFQRILYGRAIAHRPWVRREFDVLEGRTRKRVCDYEGPAFINCEPDDIVVPAERGVMSIQDFSFVVRRYPVTVDDLQRGDGSLYQGTADPDFLRQAINWARNSPGNDYTMVGQDPVRTEAEKSQGVEYDVLNQLSRRMIWIWEYYGSWRPLKKPKQDAEQDNLEKRLPYEADWVIRFIPGMRKIVGVQDLLELYPKMRRRRPFVESSLIKDGTYWSKGFGQMLEAIEDETTATSRLFTAAGELAVWPIVVYKPGAGMDPGVKRLSPGDSIPSEDPSAVNVIHVNPNLNYAIQKGQIELANAERLTGQSDSALGRSSDRPNAPRTATGQIALLEQGNIRAYLDATILKEDTEQIIEDFWDLDCDLVPKTEPGLFFRVTEEQANGLFDVAKGGAHMTAKEFGGKYDFRLKLATSVYAKEAQAQKFMAFYQMAMANPLIAMNPRAMWVLLNRAAKAMGVEDFEQIVPQPPELDTPKSPDFEWARMLEGEEMPVNPQDHDELHLVKHGNQLNEERKDPDKDIDALNMLVRHIMEHEKQKQSKILMAGMVSELVGSINQENGVGPVPGAPPMGGQPGADPNAPPEMGPEAPPPPGLNGRPSVIPQAVEGQI